jgi:WD40 repeat protein
MRAVWGFVPGLASSPDGATLITAGLLGVQTWDVESGTESGGATRTPAAQGLSLSADGALAAITTMDGAEVWNIGANSRVAVLPGDVDADEYSTALSPDGRTVAVGGFGRFVRLWDVASRALRQELDLVGGSSLTIEFSPDGSFLATAGALWDVETGTRIGPTLARSSGQGHEFENKLMMDVSPDGHRLLLSERDGLITVWDIDPVSWAQRACALANRTLTPVEWDRFLPGRPYEPACEQLLNRRSTW